MKKHRVVFSLYIPHDADVSLFIRKLHYETGTAENIKDVHHRQKVRRALKLLQTELKLVQKRKKEKNGWALFASEEKCTVIVPPFLSKLSLYRCDKTFYLEPLQTMNAGTCVTMGLVLVGGEEVELFHCRINPEKLISPSAMTTAIVEQVLVDSLSSFIRSKHGRGGFSANRFERLRENEVDHYTKEILNLHEQHNQECDMSLFYGSKDKIERLKNHFVRDSSFLAFVVGNPSDKKASTNTFLEIALQFFRNGERKALALLNQHLLENQGDSLVYGENECKLARDQKMVQRIWMSAKEKDTNYCEKQRNEYIIHGFTVEGVKFRKEFGIIALLYPGSILEKT